jgi:hypothetical protein
MTTTQRNTRTNWMLNIAIALIVIGVFLLRECTRPEPVSLPNSDSIQYYKDKLGFETARRHSIEFEHIKSARKYIKQIESQDKQIEALKRIVKDSKSFGVAIETITKIDTFGITDTVYLEGEFPRYKYGFKDDWLTLNIDAGKDSTWFEFINRNELSIHDTWDKKAKRTIVEVKQMNPYTSTSNMQSYVVTPPKKRTGLKIGIGVMVGLVLGLVVN